MNIRVGNGYDVHKLAENRKLIIGGVEIPHYKGSVAHSDGDVLIHAICDALLGAANLNDIGYHFPDTDPAFKNISSLVLLEKTRELISGKGYIIVNIDAVICLQTPKLKPFVPAMKEKLAAAMNTSVDNVSVKATTTEKLGFVGNEEGISAYAVVLLEQTS
ncbi:MAG TPA: 2-C-methyl-D-erythritol 2,4-cyclodiphosphate synthase [Bacteroidales bacterium]|nr:2-C-methyl-D-erythritol 2,4-cyclodiphosphate synthase [Bacteroidales bacterium]